MLSTVTQRVCGCSCGELFKPTFPGSKYKRGHKPSRLLEANKAGVAKLDSRARPTLDYQIAQATARKDLLRITAEIDVVDDLIETARKHVADLETRKDALATRHAALLLISEGIGIVLEGK